MDYKFLNKSSLLTTRELELEREIRQEFFRQLRLKFYISLGVSTASAIVVLIGILLLYCGKVSEASIITATGVLSSLISINSLKETKKTSSLRHK